MSLPSDRTCKVCGGAIPPGFWASSPTGYCSYECAEKGGLFSSRPAPELLPSPAELHERRARLATAAADKLRSLAGTLDAHVAGSTASPARIGQHRMEAAEALGHLRESVVPRSPPGQRAERQVEILLAPGTLEVGADRLEAWAKLWDDWAAFVSRPDDVLPGPLEKAFSGNHPPAPQKPDDVVDRGGPSASSVPTSPGFSGAATEKPLEAMARLPSLEELKKLSRLERALLVRAEDWYQSPKRHRLDKLHAAIETFLLARDEAYAPIPAPQKPDDVVVDRGDLSGAEEQPSSMPEEEMEEILRELDAEEATKKPPDDVSTIAHPPVPSSGDLSAAAVESPPDGSELPGIGRPGVPPGGVSTAAYDFSDELAGLAVAFTLLGFLPDITEHEDGSASVPAHVWAELKDAIAEWGKTPTEALFLAMMGAHPASPAKPPHEEETGSTPPSPLGACRPREGTSPAMEGEQPFGWLEADGVDADVIATDAGSLKAAFVRFLRRPPRGDDFKALAEHLRVVADRIDGGVLE